MSRVQPAYDIPAPVVVRNSAANRPDTRDEDVSSKESITPSPMTPREEARIEASESVVRDLEAEANDKLEDTAVHVKIDRDEDLNRFVVKVLDDDGELLHQFPSEDFLATAVQLEELRGLLFEAKG